MFTSFIRCMQILRICLQYSLYESLPESWLKTFLGVITKVFNKCSSTPYSAADYPSVERTRLAMEALGPIYIKFGQMLSTRHDALSYELTSELAKLQDDVPGFDSQIAREIIEQELKQPIEACFSRFDETPLASASVAQIHTACLHSKEATDLTEVVIKVIRPDIFAIIQMDIRLLKSLSKTLWHLVPATQRFHIPTLVNDYEEILMDELDLTQEAANAQQFANNFEGSDLLYVPKVYWPYVTEQVMVSERIYGVPVNDIDALKSAGVNMEFLAERGAEIFFTQVFRDNFFHADMHPGNIFVDISQPDLPRYIALDCAIVGRLSPMDQWLLGKQLLALMEEDYEALAKLMIQAGWVPEDTPIASFSNAIARICRPIFSKPLSEIEFGQLLVRLFGIARKYNLQSLPQLMILEKTLLHVEGLGRQLYPDLDIWKIGRPMLEQWLRSKINPETLYNELEKHLPLWLGYLTKMPAFMTEKMEVCLHSKKFTSHKPNYTQPLVSSRQLLALLSLVFAGFAAYDPAFGFLGWQSPLTSWITAGVGFYLLLFQKKP